MADETPEAGAGAPEETYVSEDGWIPPPNVGPEEDLSYLHDVLPPEEEIDWSVVPGPINAPSPVGPAPPPPKEIREATSVLDQVDQYSYGQPVVLPRIPEPKTLPPVDLPPEDTWRRWESPLRVDRLEDLQLQATHYPQEGIFPAFVKYMRPRCVPDAHSFGVAVAAFSVALGPFFRLRTIERGLMCNNYVLLLAVSGAGKSMALDGVKVLVPRDVVAGPTPANPFEINAGPGLAGGLIEGEVVRSAPAWVERLREQPMSLSVLDEAGTIFKRLATDDELPYWLTTAYDGRPIGYSRSDKKGQKDRCKVDDPMLCPSLLTASIFEGLLPRFRNPKDVEDLFTSGLMGRFLVFPGVGRPGLPRACDAKTGKALGDWFRALGRARPAQAGAWNWLDLSPEARVELEIWQRQSGRAPDPLLAGLWNRGALFAQKLAMMYHISTGHQYWQPISAEHIVQAIRVVHELVIPTHWWMIRQACRTPAEAAMDQVRGILGDNPRQLHFLADVCKTARLSKRLTQGEVLGLMLALGEIEFSRWRAYGAHGPARYAVAARGCTPETVDGWRRVSGPSETEPPSEVARSQEQYEGEKFGDPV